MRKLVMFCESQYRGKELVCQGTRSSTLVSSIWLLPDNFDGFIQGLRALAVASPRRQEAPSRYYNMIRNSFPLLLLSSQSSIFRISCKYIQALSHKVFYGLFVTYSSTRAALSKRISLRRLHFDLFFRQLIGNGRRTLTSSTSVLIDMYVVCDKYFSCRGNFDGRNEARRNLCRLSLVPVLVTSYQSKPKTWRVS